MPPRKKSVAKGATAKAVAAPKTAAPKKAPEKTASVAKTAAAPKKAPAPKTAKAPATAADEDEEKTVPTKQASKKRKSPADDDEVETGSHPKKQKTSPKPAAVKKASPKAVTNVVPKAAPKAAVKAAPKTAAKAAPKSPAKAKAPAKPRAARKKTPAPADDQATDIEDLEDKENEVPAGNVPIANKKRTATAEPEPAKEPAKETAAQPVKARPAKKTKAAVASKAPYVRFGAKINDAPANPLEVFVFGEGGSGELGLGSRKKAGKIPIDVKRPRLNPNLMADKVGVVQIATGGMHTVVLTKDNRVLTWGVNDQGTLGRDTTWDADHRDASAEDSDDEDDTGLNPKESTPAEIDLTDVADGTKFVQVAASDSASFALTEDGRVYGWGTFRASDGVLGFTKNICIRRTPMLLPEPKKVTHLAVGSNHILALDAKGKVFTWGCPEQNQLGRRCVLRDMKESALRPAGVGFKRGVHIKKIACGSYHSFALDDAGRVYAWGLNNFGQLGLGDGAGESDAAVLDATLITALSDHTIVDIVGGVHHSLACTKEGELLTWGRLDGDQIGIDRNALAKEDVIYDDKNKPRILSKPTVIPDLPSVVSASAGTDNSFAVTRDGQVYSWGFSGNYQTGLGTIEDVKKPTLIDNSAVRDKKLIYAGAGGQFSILASHAPEVEMVNGV